MHPPELGDLGGVDINAKYFAPKSNIDFIED